MKILHAIWAVILLYLLIYALPAFAGMNQKIEISNAKRMVEVFCKAEFEGDEYDQRVKTIKYSPIREKKEKQRTGHASPWVVFWDWDRFYIVSSYRVLDIELKDAKGVATVEYQRIAESIGKGKIVPSLKDHDIVKLDLIFDGKQWWIFDPPAPHISSQVLLEIYERDLKNYGDSWLKQASNEQKEVYFQKQEALKTLKSLVKR